MPRRMTQEEAEAKALSKGFELLSTYTNSEAVVKLRCTDCNHIHEKRFDSTISRGVCVECGRGTKPRKPLEKVDSQCLEAGYKRLSPYTKSKDKGYFECLKCSHVMYTDFHSVTRGLRECQACKGVIRRKIDYGRIVEDLAKKDVEFLGDKLESYDTSDYFMFKHSTCGNTWRARLGNVLYSTSCPKCVSSYQPNPEEITERLLSIDGVNEAELVGEYRNNRCKVKLTCKNGHSKIRPIYSVIKNGHYCWDCHYTEKHERLAREYKDLGYTIVKPYPTVFKSSLDVVCDNCGNMWRSHISSTLKRDVEGCPKCAAHGRAGVDLTGSMWLYYLKYDNGSEVFYKIGITKHDNILDRFQPRDAKYLQVIDKLYFNLGKDAHDLEQQYLRDYADFRYKGPPILKSGGSTELFTRDVLNLDNP